MLNAFLHGVLNDEVFMHMGFHDKTNPNYLCRLLKSIYGLRQSPCVWFHRLRDRLLTIGFKEGILDSSLFVCIHDKVSTYLLVYVDDIMVISSSQGSIDTVVSQLREDFKIKDLGNPTYFLGIHVLRTGQIVLVTTTVCGQPTE